MAIIGKAAPRSEDIIERVANQVGCDPAVIDAIITVEVGKDAFDPSRRLVARPEVHKIASCPYLDAADRKRAASKGFTKAPKLVGYHVDPVRAGNVVWAWIDKFAAEFGEEPAFYVCSFGAPQIMGFNFRMVGYDSPSAMVRAFADGEDAQLEAMGRFLIAAGLKEACRLKKWQQIARTYNGKNYAQNSYDKRLETAYNESRYGKTSGFIGLDDGVWEFGERGPIVKSIQERLRELGFYVDADGDFGPETREAVRSFQFRRGVTVDGKVGPETMQALNEAPPKEPNQKPVIQIAKDSVSVQTGVATVATGATSAAVAVANAVAPAPPPLPTQGDIEGVLKVSDAGIALASKILAIGVDKLLIALSAGAIIFGAMIIYRRIKAQRERKIG